jgi:hypothetical protein
MPSGRFSLLVGVVASLISLALFSSPAAAFDVAVGEIHITQSIQTFDPRFWVPLVAERNTAVRVEVVPVSGTPGPVTGTLKVYVDGREITPPGGLDDLNRTFPAPYNSFVPPVTQPPGGFLGLLEFEEHTLNFELLAQHYPIAPSGNQGQSTNVDFRVEIFAEGDTNPNNNIAWTNNLTVIRRGAPWLFKDRVIFLPNGNPPPSGAARPRESFIAPGIGDVMTPALWPIPDAPTNTGTQTNPIFPPILPRLTYTRDCDGDGKITRTDMVTQAGICYGPTGNVIGDETGFLIHHLQLRRQLLVSGGFGPDRLVYLYGWVRDGNLAGYSGVALRGGNVGYGTDANDRGQKTFAHEFGHMVGLPHNMPGRVIDPHGWDVGARLHNNPLGMPDGVTGRVKPRAFYSDVMNDSGAAQTRNTWIDLESYTALLHDPKLALRAPQPCPEVILHCEQFETAVVVGIPAGDPKIGTRMQARIVTYPWYTERLWEAEQPNLIVTLTVEESGTGALKVIEVPIDARLSIDLAKGGGQDEGIGPFVAPIPVLQDTKIRSLRIDGLKDGLLSTELQPSTYVPTVAIVSPKPHTVLGPKTTIAWLASDQDKDATLTYQVAYSPNDGFDFIPVEVDLEGTSLTIDATTLPKTQSGRGLMRVFVNDGLHTSYADVGGLSIAP